MILDLNGNKTETPKSEQATALASLAFRSPDGELRQLVVFSSEAGFLISGDFVIAGVSHQGVGPIATVKMNER